MDQISKSKNNGNKNKLNKVIRFIKRHITLKRCIQLVVVIVIVAVAAKFGMDKLHSVVAKDEDTVVETAKVETKDIQNVLSSSGTIQPLNEYDITTLVQGEVLAADFEEGDQVKKGDVLYKIDTDSVESQIESATTSVERAKKNYSKAEESLSSAKEKYSEAKEDYNDAVADYNENKEELTDSLNVKSSLTGVISSVYVKAGDEVTVGAKIADVKDTSTMLLEVPFNAQNVNSSLVGKTAKVKLSNSSTTLTGTVTSISNESEMVNNTAIKVVYISVKKSSKITSSTSATASISGISSFSTGTFSANVQTITAEKAGEIKSLKIAKNKTIKKNDVIFIYDESAIENELSTYEQKVDNTKNSLESAKSNVENAEDQIDTSEDSIDDANKNLDDKVDELSDYNITAPISGQIIKKNTLVGDTVGASNGTDNVLATIYDLSAVTFEMSIDELDILNVKVGQKVNVTADALDGQTFEGEVTNISLESTTESGVTQYPVTVRIDDAGDLLPGMNVTGEIVIDEVTGVLAVPVDALMRGNMVYVKDDSVTEANGDIPAGFKAVQVETGLTDEDYIEIKSGLTGNEEVYVKRKSSGTTMQMMPGMENGKGFGGSGGFGVNGSNSGFGGSGNSGGRPSGGGMPSGGN